jgi:capsular polysaccharide biosynthesis protein
MFTNYWHWHTDCLPILHQAQSVLRDEHTVLTPPLTGWRKRSADMLLDASRTLEQDSLVRVDGVYCSAHLDGRSNFPDADVMATFARLRAAAGAAVGPVADGERVFLSRKDATAGRLLENEDELFAALAPYGFQHRLMSELDYADQIRLFAGASMVVGSHGAGLTNLGFCSPGCVVFEIIELSRLIGAMRYLSVRAGLNHHWYSVGDDQSARLDVPAFMTYFEAQAAP